MDSGAACDTESGAAMTSSVAGILGFEFAALLLPIAGLACAAFIVLVLKWALSDSWDGDH